MPKYSSRYTEEEIPKDFDKINLRGGNKVLDKQEPLPEPTIDMLGGAIMKDIMEARKPHNEMIRAVLKMKPRDIHLLKKSAKYFLDNPDDLDEKIEEEALEDLAKTINSNDLADMLEVDFNMTNGGELDGNTLLESLSQLFIEMPKLEKIISI
mgnify:FL=1